MPAKQKDHTKTIQAIKKTVADLKNNVKSVSEKDREFSPDDHKAALDHFSQQFKLAMLNKDKKAASMHAKSYHDYAAKLTKHYQSKLKESAKQEGIVMKDNQLDEAKGLASMSVDQLKQEHEKVQQKISDAGKSKMISMNHPLSQRARLIRLHMAIKKSKAVKENYSKSPRTSLIKELVSESFKKKVLKK